MTQLSIGWTGAGNLRVDDVHEDQPRITVMFHAVKRSRLEKLELLREVVEQALNTVELTGEGAA